MKYEKIIINDESNLPDKAGDYDTSLGELYFYEGVWVRDGYAPGDYITSFPEYWFKPVIEKKINLSFFLNKLIDESYKKISVYSNGHITHARFSTIMEKMFRKYEENVTEKELDDEVYYSFFDKK